MSLYMGIEACTKNFTVLAVAREDGQVIAEERFGVGLNFHEMSKQELAGEIYDLVRKTLQTCRTTVKEFCKNGGKICAGITGVTTKFDREVGMQGIWEAAGLKEEVPKSRIATGDIEIVFTGATRSLEGAAIVCQAGSVALARTEGFIQRVGGWGPLLGDEGSGYWIGSRALNTVCLLRDGRLSEGTVLANYVDTQLRRLQEELSYEYKATSSDWADALIHLVHSTRDDNQFFNITSKLSESVIAAYYDHPADPVVNTIIDTAADALIRQVDTALKKTGLQPSEIPLVLWGEVFRYKPSGDVPSPPFFDLVKQKASEEFPLIYVVPAEDLKIMRPIVGALLFALSGDMHKLPSREIIEQVEQHFAEFSADLQEG